MSSFPAIILQEVGKKPPVRRPSIAAIAGGIAIRTEPAKGKTPWYLTNTGLTLVMLGISAFVFFFVLTVFLVVSSIKHSDFRVPDSSSSSSKGGIVKANWGQPFNIRDLDQETSFLVTFKDAWYVDWGDGMPKSRQNKEDGKVSFVVVYSCKNLGPREGKLVFRNEFGVGDIIEIKTGKGSIFCGGQLDQDFRGNVFFGDWRGKVTNRIDETSEDAVCVSIPKGEIPAELSIKRGIGEVKVKIPQQSFGTKNLRFLP